MHKFQGNLVHPDWIEDGGYFWNGKTYIGIIDDDESRLYYVPDTLTEMLKSELKTRVIDQQSNTQVTDKITNKDGSLMNEQELKEYIDQWWTEKVEN